MIVYIDQLITGGSLCKVEVSYVRCMNLAPSAPWNVPMRIVQKSQGQVVLGYIYIYMEGLRF